MEDLLQIMDTLDSQFIILNIEGILSECNIYEWEEEGIDEKECNVCQGECQIKFFNETGVYSIIEDCPKCGGCGIIEKSKMITVKEVGIESNIFI